MSIFSHHCVSCVIVKAHGSIITIIEGIQIVSFLCHFRGSYAFSLCYDLILLWLYVCTYIHVEVRGQPATVSAFLSLRGSQ